MTAKTAQVTAVIVTYGDRWHLLSQVLAELTHQSPRPTAIVVVDNASSYNLSERLRRDGLEDVIVVHMPDNSGSAGGYARGINEALRGTEARLIWLLDDDNRPTKGCLGRLLTTYEMLGEDPNVVLVGLRKSREEQVGAVIGERDVRVRPNAFLGFHVAEIPKRLMQRFHSAKKSTVCKSLRYPVVSVNYAPYGGLLFHCSWVDRIGLPDERFYIYGDDHEYTGRMISAGGSIFLVGYCEIEDLEISWSEKPARAPVLASRTSNPTKVFYTVRNRVYWEWSNHVSSPAVYFLNLVICMVVISILGLIAEGAPLSLGERIVLLVRAIRRGLAGRLGRGEID